MSEDCCLLDHGPEKPETADTKPDILIIGGGSAAISAADTGARVVIAGEGTIGGTWLIAHG